MPIKTVTILTGGVSQDLFPAFSAIGGFIINAVTENAIIQFGSDASPTNGETIYKGSPAKFSYKEFPEMNARISIYSATTGSVITIRPIS